MEYYWDTFRLYTEKLKDNGHLDLVEQLKEAQKYVNGLTDGWYEYLTRLKKINEEWKHTLEKDDSDKLRYLVESIDSMLKKR